MEAAVKSVELLFAWSGRIQPVPLGRPRIVSPRGRVMAHLQAKDHAFRAELQMAWRADKAIRRVVRQPFEGDLAVIMSFAGNNKPTQHTPPGLRARPRPDLSNLIKAVEDAGNGFLWADDRQIVSLVAELRAWGGDVEPCIDIHAYAVVSR